MWVPPHVIVPHGANMRETLICHMICIIYIYIYIEKNAPHMAYEGIPHICICGTITWGERVSGMWGPPSLSPCDFATWGKYEENSHMPYEVHFSLSLSPYIYTHTHTHTYIYVCVYIYTYIYVCIYI